MLAIARMRRVVGTILMVTLMPALTGCYHRAAFSPGGSPPATGQQIQVKHAAPVTANVILKGGVHVVVEQVVEAVGSVAPASGDSVRLSNAAVKLAGGRSWTRYAEVAFAVSPDMSVAAMRLDLVRTTIVVAGVALVVLAAAAALALSGLDFGDAWQPQARTSPR